MQTELSSFLIEITALIFKKKDEDEKSYILDSILDKTGMKGTGNICQPHWHENVKAYLFCWCRPLLHSNCIQDI